MRLDKPIGTLLLLWPTLSALWLAADGAPRLSLILIFAVGTLVMRSAGCAMNDWADRDFDAHVARTAQRPLAAGVIAPSEALAVASVGSSSRSCWCSHQPATMLWSLPALAITIAIRSSSAFSRLPQAFLGIAFSFGIPMAYAAVQDRVPAFAWLLLALNLFWVVAYDTEYAMVDRDDDVKIGIRTSALTFGRYDVVAVALCYAAYRRRHAVGRARPRARRRLFRRHRGGCADRPPSRRDDSRARSGRVLPRVSSAITGSA
jgi:4-hydroxybenzoate polyprenyltransferase